MMSIKQFMANHHEHCDHLFASAEQAASQQDWTACKDLQARFSAAMDAHFRAEEDLLFPALEQSAPGFTGPTEVMRMEHAQMRELLASLADAAVDESDLDFFGTSDTLVVFMEQHNRKEEGILYPMCDDHLAERERVVEQLQRLVDDPA